MCLLDGKNIMNPDNPVIGVNTVISGICVRDMDPVYDASTPQRNFLFIPMIPRKRIVFKPSQSYFDYSA